MRAASGSHGGCREQGRNRSINKREDQTAKYQKQPLAAASSPETGTEPPTGSGCTKRPRRPALPQFPQSGGGQSFLRHGSAEQRSAGIVVHEDEDALRLYHPRGTRRRTGYREKRLSHYPP